MQHLIEDDFQHFILHKPFGYLTQFVYNGKGKAKLLGELHDFPDGTMAIGRLDKNSEGLLLLTTNGKVSYLICSRKVDKEYFVQLDGIIDDEAIQDLETGVEISIEGEKYKTLPCKVKRLVTAPAFPERNPKVRDDRHGPTSWASITITEGKYKQVRKMTAVVGFPTLRLVRNRIGNIHLGDLVAGQVKAVDFFDIPTLLEREKDKTIP
ncbi:UNVERIFIED_CONTAM: hypothetical protein GTU68_061374 [Idotea baltica]|nr:hypothetical protein [Idotea baltica]